MATTLLMEMLEFLVIGNELEKEAIKELAEIDKAEKVNHLENLEESKLLFRPSHEGNQHKNMQ